MDILIFDMDGVLLEAKGYQFESLGISSEWHSSALCLAVLKVQLLAEFPVPNLDLTRLFAAIRKQPLSLPARQRSELALASICAEMGVAYRQISSLIQESEDIDRSLTMNWFQELVLGSVAYQSRYGKKPRLDTPSYLEVHDRRLLSPAIAELISSWTGNGGLGTAIMTNRPSAGPGDFKGSPEAELGRDLVGLADVPLIGYGEIAWLAGQSGNEADALAKPNPSHALAAIFCALGLPEEISLTASLGDFTDLDQSLIGKLRGKRITVFEDTPAGIRSVHAAGRLLQKTGIQVEIIAVGIAVSEIKRRALEAEGAQVYPDINTALAGLDHL
jgi:hypothetical protein